jgi:hypothetical protein
MWSSKCKGVGKCQEGNVCEKCWKCKGVSK